MQVTGRRKKEKVDKRRESLDNEFKRRKRRKRKGKRKKDGRREGKREGMKKYR